MARLVVHIPEQTYSFDLDDDTAQDFRNALADEDNEWAFYDMADMWVSDVHVEMETEFEE
jgi:hypothetical protein